MGYCCCSSRVLQNGDKLVFGAPGVVVGPGKLDAETVDVMFAFNESSVTMPLKYVVTKPMSLSYVSATSVGLTPILEDESEQHDHCLCEIDVGANDVQVSHCKAYDPEDQTYSSHW